MPPAYKFTAPWGKQLKWLTTLACVVLLGTPLLMMANAPETDSALYTFGTWLPIGILLLTALFAVRGYEVSGNTLWVQRLLWKTKCNLDGRVEVRADPDAMKHAVRIFGNGGLFAYTGIFSNKHTGRFRAFATDPARAVVIRFPERSLVVTPDRPDKLVTLLQPR